MSLITLENEFVSPPLWENGVLCNHDLTGNIHIWQIDIHENLQHINVFRNVLTHDEIARANKYLRDSNRDRFIISRGGLRYILSGYLKYPPADIRFKLTANNKPETSQPVLSGLHFNLSDSGDKVLIAVATTPVGIDIEFINPKFGYQAILNNNFSSHEAAYINFNDNYKRFFLLWTRKEAILKATGIGLTDHLKLIPALDGQHVLDSELLLTDRNWHLRSFEVDGDYVATIAADVLKNGLIFWNFCLH